MAKIALGGFIGAVGVAGKHMVTMASDAAEVQSKMEVIFGRTLPGLTKNLDAFSKATGASRFELREQVADMGALLAPLLGTKQAAAGMSSQFVKLATDIGSFYNVPTADALLAIRSGLVGEAEPLRRFGVLLNEAAVKAEGLRLGLVKGKEVMTESEKVQARASLIMKQTTLAQGDATRTAESFANQMKRLKNSVIDAATEMGSRLIPVILPMVQRFNGFLTELFSQKTFSAKLNVVWEGIQAVAQDLIGKIRDEIHVLFVGQDVFSVQEKAMIHIDPQLQIDWGKLRQQFKDGFMSALSGDSASQELGDKLMAGLARVGERLGAWAKSEPGRVVRDIKAAFNTADITADLDKFILGPLRAAAGVVQTNANRIVSVIRAVVNPIGTAAQLIGDRIISGITGALGPLVSQVGAKLMGVVSAVDQAGAKAFAAAQRIGSQIISGVLSALGGLYGAVKGKIEGVLSSVLSSIDIPGFSPPEHAAAKAIGEPLGRGVINGWIRSTATLPEKMSATLKAAIEKARAAIESARDRLGSAFDGMTARILRAFDAENAGMETTHEKILREIDERRQMEDLVHAQADAQIRLNEAIATGGDIVSAQRDLDRATEDIAKVGYEKQADQERIQLDSQNEERRIALEKRLEQLKAHFEKEGATTKQALNAITKIMRSFNVDFGDAGALLGAAFAQGLNAAINAAVRGAGVVNAAVPGSPGGYGSSAGIVPLTAEGVPPLTFNNYAPINSERQLEDMIVAASARVRNRGGLG